MSFAGIRSAATRQGYRPGSYQQTLDKTQGYGTVWPLRFDGAYCSGAWSLSKIIVTN